jgi:Uma2 family endonuclease
VAIQKKLYSAEEFERLADLPENADRRFELINGEIYEKMPTEEHGVIVLRIGSRILAFVETRKLGWVGVEIRHRAPGDKQNARLPDVSFTSDATRALVNARPGR